MDELLIFLHNLNCPNILLFCEHWLKPDEPVHIPNYNVLAKYCRESALHGGTIIFIDAECGEQFSFKMINTFDCVLEERVFELSVVYCKRLNLYILCLYRSPTGNIETFLIKLDSVLSQLNINSVVILCGDFNIDILDKLNNNTQNLLNLLFCYNISVLVDQPTRITCHSATAIDYVCSNIELDNVDCQVIGAGVSDHEAIYCKFSIKYRASKVPKRKGRIFSKRNYDRFSQLCSLEDWSTVLSSDCPLSIFHRKLTACFNNAFPLRTLKHKRKKPWITKGIKVSSQNMRALHYIRNFFSNNEFFMQYFKKYRRCLTCL